MENYLIFALLLGVVTFFSVFRKEMFLLSLSSAVLTFVFFGLINYFIPTTLSFWGFDGVWIELTIAAAFGVFLSVNIYETFRWYNTIPLAIILLVGCIRIITSTPMGRSDKFQEQLQIVEVPDSLYNKQAHPIALDKMINVTSKYALEKASNLISKAGSYSQFGTPTMINLNGDFQVTLFDGKIVNLSFDNDPVWVMPLEHTGFWKWRKFKSTSGYAIVSANNPEKVYCINKVNGKDVKLKYLTSGCFSDYLLRHVRTSGYASYGLTDWSFELDDAGTPFAVITIYKPKIGFSANEAIGVLTVDIQTGEIIEYTIANAPTWIDCIQPSYFIETQLENWGQYIHGYINWSNTDKKQPTPGITKQYSNGKCYFYTGIQTVGDDKTTLGFVLIDTRTKEAMYYNNTGLNEQKAMDVVLKKSEFAINSKSQLQASPVCLHVIHGEQTFFMTVSIDGSQTVGYGFVSMNSEQIYGVESNIQDALKSYYSSLQKSGNYKITDGQVSSVQSQEHIVRGITLEDGVYYLLLHNVKGVEFTAVGSVYPELKWTKVGDKVKVSYRISDSTIIMLDSYENLSFEL